jgi:phage terminase large subunit
MFTIREDDMRIHSKNGNQILFAGIDDPEKIKSIHSITSIWIEEVSDLLPEGCRQLDIRLRGRTKQFKQMIITFSPIDVNHWLKKESFYRKNWTAQPNTPRTKTIASRTRRPFVFWRVSKRRTRTITRCMRLASGVYLVKRYSTSTD